MTEEKTPDAYITPADSISYWSNIPPTVNGMLGGYPQVSRIDLRGSHNFLAKIRRLIGSSSGLLPRAVDCGAGIGRVTAGFLSHVCEVIDIVEPIPKFAETAAALTTEELGVGKLGNVFTTGLEDWVPGSDGTRYDLIWNQWCLGHLNNQALVEYLQRCKGALVAGGLLVVKENTATGESDLFDEEDSSATRTAESFKSCFKEAGWKVLETEEQKGFPKELGLYPVRFWALQPQK